MSSWIDVAVDIWICIFAASFFSSFVIGAVQIKRGKNLTDTPLLPIQVVLHFAWVIPFGFYVVLTTVGTWGPMLGIALVGLPIFLGVAWLAGHIERRR
ncbi:hypothetical protein SAMN05443247_05501 [Bradyrhizobium erythrophlei]|nr:hypothetical protein SAMN05443247_05501 [Bradyrhizobium erythrophlei]